MAHGRRAHASAWLLAVIVSVVLLRTSGGDDTLHSAGGFAILGSTQRRTARFGSRAMEAAGRGDCEWAAHLYQRAVSISPADPHVHAVAARHAWEGEGRHDKAEDLLERAMALEPRHPTVALEAARFMMTSSRDAASAEFVLKAAIEHNAGGFLPGLQREHLRFALATAISEQGGRGLEAEQIFREVIDALPAASTSAAASPAGLEAVRVKLHAAALSNLGLLIIARNRNAHGGGNAGDLAEARSLLEKSARMDPSGSAGANLATYLSRGVGPRAPLRPAETPPASVHPPPRPTHPPPGSMRTPPRPMQTPTRGVHTSSRTFSPARTVHSPARPARDTARDLQGAARPDQASPSQAAQNPDGAAALMRRAAALQETSGFETEERALLERAVALEPNNPGTHAALAYLHQRAGRYAKAEQGYSSALSLDHNHAVALCNKALLFELRGDTQGAADMYRKALEVSPDHTPTLYNYGSLLQEALGDMDGAAQMYSEVLAREPNHVQCLCNYAPNAHFIAHDAASALISCLRIVLEMDHRRDVPAAQALFERALQVDPNDPTALLNYADLIRDTPEADASKAVEMYESALRLDPQDAQAMCSFARLKCDKMGDRKGAAELLRKSIAINPADHVTLCTCVALGLLDGYELRGASALVERAQRSAPHDPAVHCFRAVVKHLHGKRDEAETAWRLAESLNPSSPMISTVRNWLDTVAESEQSGDKEALQTPGRKILQGMLTGLDR